MSNVPSITIKLNDGSTFKGIRGSWIYFDEKLPTGINPGRFKMFRMIQQTTNAILEFPEFSIMFIDWGSQVIHLTAAEASA